MTASAESTANVPSIGVLSANVAEVDGGFLAQQLLGLPSGDQVVDIQLAGLESIVLRIDKLDLEFHCASEYRPVDEEMRGRRRSVDRINSTDENLDRIRHVLWEKVGD